MIKGAKMDTMNKQESPCIEFPYRCKNCNMSNKCNVYMEQFADDDISNEEEFDGIWIKRGKYNEQ